MEDYRPEDTHDTLSGITADIDLSHLMNNAAAPTPKKPIPHYLSDEALLEEEMNTVPHEVSFSLENYTEAERAKALQQMGMHCDL